jgi:hypothetical protein
VIVSAEARLHLTPWRDGQCIVETPLADTDDHARWIEWISYS